MIFFTSDHHFGHANSIVHGKRPFSDVEDMRQGLIANWNCTVGHKDEVYILGDFSFMKLPDTVEILKLLNGKKHLIIGNHDHKNIKPELNYFLHSDPVPYKEIRVEGQFIVMCHYPFETWNRSHHGSWHLHGHCHGTLKTRIKNRVDVGVDCQDYRPLSFLQLLEFLGK